MPYANPQYQDQSLALQGQAGNRQYLPNYHQMLAAQMTRRIAGGERPSATGMSQAHMLGGMRNLRASQEEQTRQMSNPAIQQQQQMYALLQPMNIAQREGLERGGWYGRRNFGLGGSPAGMTGVPENQGYANIDRSGMQHIGFSGGSLEPTPEPAPQQQGVFESQLPPAGTPGSGAPGDYWSFGNFR